MSYLSHLECSRCRVSLDADKLWNLCPDCNKPLFARYNLSSLRSRLTRDTVKKRSTGLWRYHELLPVKNAEYRISLGEGGTPLFRAHRLEKSTGIQGIYIKDEGMNPTGSFKARGLSVAVSRAVELAAVEFSIPSAGNAAGALSAYSAKAGKPAHVFMPKDVPSSFVVECRALGASVRLVDGLIPDCARIAGEEANRFNRFDLSTLKEPYRLEGKKTMGYEIAEQLGWELPEVIIYPTGGGTGLVGLWKAFDEMEEMGWISEKRPRMVSVQATGCAPIVKAFREKRDHAETWSGAKTIADGLRVPSAVGDFIILDILKKSHGIALDVSDEDMMKGAEMIGSNQGLFVSPESGATIMALIELNKRGWTQPGERTVLFNTGSGYKYSHLWK